MTEYAPQGITTLTLKLVTGILTAIVPHERKGIDRYVVEATYTKTAIRGTEVRVSTDGATDEVFLRDGEVLVSLNSGAKELTLKSNQKAIASSAATLAIQAFNGLAESEDKFYRNVKELYGY